MPATVAIVGRPNVGKSRLFNRLARRRISIVHDQPGVTRDIVSAEMDGYTLLDTGGFGLSGDDTPEQIKAAVDQQVLFSIEMAHVILFVIDAHDGIVPLDEAIAERLRESGKSVQLIVNKVDSERHEDAVAEAWRLGLGEPLAISAEHGRGEGDLRRRIRQMLDEVGVGPAEAAAATADGERRLRVCFIGKPNVGKSSLTNRVLGADRMIVSDVPGTTRESVELDFEYRPKKGEPWKFTLTDTAGLKRSTRINSPVEYFSQVRSLGAIQRSDVVFMVLDALEGVGAVDKAIAGEAVKAHKPIVIVVNKWDLAREAIAAGSLPQYENENHFRKAFAEAVERQLFFSPGSPIIFTSALTGLSIELMLKAARRVDALLDTQMPTARLNKRLQYLTERTPPPRVEGKRFRVFYAVQTGTRPFRIRIFCNQARRLSDSYRRYLEAGLIEEFGLHGCPMLFDLVGKEPRYSDLRK